MAVRSRCLFSAYPNISRQSRKMRRSKRLWDKLLVETSWLSSPIRKPSLKTPFHPRYWQEVNSQSDRVHREIHFVSSVISASVFQFRWTLHTNRWLPCTRSRGATATGSATAGSFWSTVCTTTTRCAAAASCTAASTRCTTTAR